jgi:hypothetical protein
MESKSSKLYFLPLSASSYHRLSTHIHLQRNREEKCRLGKNGKVKLDVIIFSYDGLLYFDQHILCVSSDSINCKQYKM